MSGSAALTGAGFEMPPNTRLIVVRAPADTDASVFEGMKLSDLVEDEPTITKQIAIAYYKDEASGFVQATPAKSFALVEKSISADEEPKVVRLERPPMIPPTNLKVSPLPFDTTVSRQNQTTAKPKKSKKRQVEEATTEAPVESSSKKKKKQKEHQ